MLDEEGQRGHTDEQDKSLLYDLHELITTRGTEPALKTKSLKELFEIFSRQKNDKIIDKAYNFIYDIILNTPPEVIRETMVSLGEFGKNNANPKKNLMAVDILGRILEEPLVETKAQTWLTKDYGKEETVNLHDIAVESILTIGNSTTQGNKEESGVAAEAMSYLNKFTQNCSEHKDFTPQTNTVNRASNAWKSIATKTQRVRGFDALDSKPVLSSPRNATLLKK